MAEEQWQEETCRVPTEGSALDSQDIELNDFLSKTHYMRPEDRGYRVGPDGQITFMQPSDGPINPRYFNARILRKSVKLGRLWSARLSQKSKIATSDANSLAQQERIAKSSRQEAASYASMLSTNAAEGTIAGEMGHVGPGGMWGSAEAGFAASNASVPPSNVKKSTVAQWLEEYEWLEEHGMLGKHLLQQEDEETY